MEEITKVINNFCANKGFEASPFKLKWYNASVTNDKFKLTCAPDDSLAFVIISQPSMFEATFLPFVNEHWDQIQNNVLVDLLDQCMKPKLHLGQYVIVDHFPELFRIS